MKFILTSITKAFNIFAYIGKLSWPYQVLVFLSMFLRPITIPILLLIALLFFDMNASIYAQYKIMRRKHNKPLCKTGRVKTLWKILQPDRLIETVDKIIGYSIALAVCLALDVYVYQVEHSEQLVLISMTNAVFSIIATKEAVSILKNLGKITNNEVFTRIANLVTKKQKINGKKTVDPETVSDN